MSVCDDASDLASTSASTGWDLPTPALTIVSDDTTNAEQQNEKPKYVVPAAPVETVPLTGNTYVIRARDSGRAITVCNNELKLLDWESAGDKSSHWICEERHGWFSFKNAVSGKYSKYASREEHSAEGPTPLCGHCSGIRSSPGSYCFQPPSQSP